MSDFMKRQIIPEEDIYPPPLKSNSPSYKQNGFNKLLFAVWYLCPSRVRELLTNYQHKTFDVEQFKKESVEMVNITYGEKSWFTPHTEFDIGDSMFFYNRICDERDVLDIFGVDYYGNNILTIICQWSMPTNLHYQDNYKLYDSIFFTILKVLTPENR